MIKAMKMSMPAWFMDFIISLCTSSGKTLIPIKSNPEILSYSNPLEVQRIYGLNFWCLFNLTTSFLYTTRDENVKGVIDSSSYILILLVISSPDTSLKVATIFSLNHISHSETELSQSGVHYLTYMVLNLKWLGSGTSTQWVLNDLTRKKLHLIMLLTWYLIQWNCIPHVVALFD